MITSALAAAALVVLFGAPKQPDKIVVEVAQGRSEVVSLPFAPGDRLNSNPDVVQVKPGPAAKTLVFFGRETGESDYIVHDTKKKRSLHYDVRVVDPSLHKQAATIRAIVRELPNVTVQVVGDLILVEGEVDTDTELERVRLAVEGRDRARSTVGMSPAAMNAISDTIESQVNR